MLKPTVLLVEDNKADIKLVQYTFSCIDLDVQLNILNDGNNAIKFFESMDNGENYNLPDLIILDLNIPSINGFEILKVIRQIPLFTEIPVLIFTSSENENDIYKSYELNANAYIFKKHDLEDFVETLGAALKYWLIKARN